MPESANPPGRKPLVYLASASPQRRTILEELGIAFAPLPVDVAEVTAATACATVEENARRKLLAALPRAEKGAVVIAADTVLEAQSHQLGKPADEREALQYLQHLSGNTVVACSAVAAAVVGATQGTLATETAEVHFKVLSPEIIRWYLSTGEPLGRAGAFGIGRLGEILTDSITGGYSCVSGLPKTALLAALSALTPDPLQKSNLKPQTLSLLPTVYGLQSAPFGPLPTALLSPRVHVRPLPVQP
jgi:septum formation protein